MDKSDCPNEGQNYVCNTDLCECETGFRTEYIGDSCLGTLPNSILFSKLQRLLCAALVYLERINK